MPAREGFLTADIGVLFWHHRRMRKLRADLGRDEGTIVGAIYSELVLASWADGDRLELAEIDAPADLTPERLEAMRTAGLVDAQGRIPAKTWAGWFERAYGRRADLRAFGAKGAAARWSGKAPAKASPMPPASTSADSSANPSASGSANGAAYAPRPSVRTHTDETDGRVSTSRAPARPRGAPSRAAAVAVNCDDPAEHRADYQWFGDAWRCMPCEQVRAAADPISFREKVERAARREDLANPDEPEGLF